MKAPPHPDRLKKPADITLVILPLSIAFQLLAFYQARYQLVRPIVPDKIVLTIVTPYINAALFSIIALSVALAFRFYGRYMISLIICAIAFLVQAYCMELFSLF